METNDLYTVHSDHLKDRRVKQNNKHKRYKYGYDDELDCVIISRDGSVGEIYEIQGLRIGLPMPPKEVSGMHLPKEEQVFERTVLPGELTKIKSTHEFNQKPIEFQENHSVFIYDELDKRRNGHWFMCGGIPTYLTATHYVYLNYSKIDVGLPDFRQPNRIFYLFWEACKADSRCLGMCYLKNRRSGFSFMSACEAVNTATQIYNGRVGILSKTGADAKKLFTDKVVPISNNYPFWFKPITDGSTNPKTELAYRAPAKRITRNTIFKEENDLFEDSLDTTIDWKNTGNTSYDGEKLQLLIQDEAGKWEKPNVMPENYRVTQTCLILGRKIAGKVMMGSTCGALDKGGQEFKDIYYDSDLRSVKRNANGRTPSGMYSLFIDALWGMEGFFDKFGFPVIDTPKTPVDGIDGEPIDIGAREYWENQVEGLKHNQDALNEYYRQFPLTEKHAFRDEASNSIFNIQRIYEQLDWNQDLERDGIITTGRFQWENGVRDTKVKFFPDKKGRFKLSWIPPEHLQNNVINKNGINFPGNDGLGAFGCDSYDISGTVSGVGSNGALHGLTTFNFVPEVPSNRFILEYVARPSTSEIFFEDVLMACVFFGMPILCENNKPRLLYHFKRRGYRGFSMNRPDKTYQQLSPFEKECGGIPNSSEDIRQAHAGAIETYIESHVGQMDDGEFGQMYFDRTLEDWIGFDITKRTDYDATISSGLACMAVQKHLYKPFADKQKLTINLGGAIKRWNHSGNRPTLIK